MFTFSLLLLFFNPSSSSVHTFSLSFHICAVVYAIAIAASFLCVSKFLSSFFFLHFICFSSLCVLFSIRWQITQSNTANFKQRIKEHTQFIKRRQELKRGNSPIRPFIASSHSLTAICQTTKHTQMFISILCVHTQSYS